MAENKCSECGGDKNLVYAPNPYFCEIYDDETPVWLCRKCQIMFADSITG